MALARERRGAGQQVIERATEAVNVAADVGAGRVLRLFRRHEGRRAQHRPRRRQVRYRLLAPNGLGQPEIEDFDDVPLAATGQNQVVRLDVAVDHRHFVGVLQAHRRLGNVMTGVGHRQRPLTPHQLGQVFALDVLHREDEQPARLRAL